eukprot:m.55338 g.55338  ORF g.55338 m.55338 type:complete len:410 (-) comp22058_c1_seq1:253-1482(-)
MPPLASFETSKAVEQNTEFIRNGCKDDVGYYKKSTGCQTNYPRAMDMIGRTAMLDLTALANPKDPRTRVLGKAEYLNPGFSHKDRIIRNIITKAEKDGLLKPGYTVVAASSGNTGCSCAMVCAMRGYKCIIITSQKCSEEKMNSIRAFGATLLISKPNEDYMQMETDLAIKNPLWFSVNQYANLDNPEAHFLTTGPEIYEQTCGEVTHFVMSGSTGGTISGVGKYLKSRNPDVKMVLADPVGSVFTNFFKTGELGVGSKFLVEGVGKETIPGCLAINVVDEVLPVTDKDAFYMCKRLARSEGIFVGGSAGLNVHAAVELANAAEGPVTVVTILCDNGIKYLSKVFNDDWLKANNVYTAETETRASTINQPQPTTTAAATTTTSKPNVPDAKRIKVEAVPNMPVVSLVSK